MGLSWAPRRAIHLAGARRRAMMGDVKAVLAILLAGTLAVACTPRLPTPAERHSEDVDDASFAERVEQSRGVVFVSFWAPWCVPCRKLAPTYEEVAGEFGAEARFYKLNVDLAAETADAYGVEAIPVLMVFRDGVFQEMLVGGQSRSDYRAWIAQRVN